MNSSEQFIAGFVKAEIKKNWKVLEVLCIVSVWVFEIIALLLAIFALTCIFEILVILAAPSFKTQQS